MFLHYDQKIITTYKIWRLSTLFELSYFNPYFYENIDLIDIYGETVPILSISNKIIEGLRIYLQSGLSIFGEEKQKILIKNNNDIIEKSLENIECDDEIIIQNFYIDYKHYLNVPFWHKLKNKTFEYVPLFINKEIAVFFAYIARFGEFNKKRTKLFLRFNNSYEFTLCMSFLEQAHVNYKIIKPYTLVIKCEKWFIKIIDYLNIEFNDTNLPLFLWESPKQVVKRYLEIFYFYKNNLKKYYNKSEIRNISFLYLGDLNGFLTKSYIKSYKTNNSKILEKSKIKEYYTDKLKVKKYEVDEVINIKTSETIINSNGFLIKNN